jgi:CSLREA domain-containing protein
MASLGERVVHILEGDGRGGYPREASLHLDGALTSLAVGDVNRPDGISDLIVGVETDSGAALLVYESPAGVLVAEPERIALPSPARALAAGVLRGSHLTDIVAACGNAIVLVEGRDRKLHTPGAPVESARTTVLPVDAPVVSLAVGRWLAPEDGRLDLAMLASNGSLTVLRPFDDAAPSLSRRQTASIAGPRARLAVAATPDGLGDQVIVVDPDGGRARLFEADRTTTTAMKLVRDVADARGDLTTPSAPLAVLTVNSTGDSSDAVPGDGACDDGAGACTLRAAIQEANARSGPQRSCQRRG